MTKIDVDFNGFEADGQLTALVDHADGLVAPGHRVVLRDGDQNQCQATVVSVGGNGVVFLKIDWSTCWGP